MENKDKINMFLNEVKSLSQVLGIDYFIMIEGGEYSFSNDNGDSIVKDVIDNYNKQPDVTFKDLFDYIQTAERDEFGYHDPFPNDKSLPKLLFHIYDNKRQVNITYMQNTGDPSPSSIGNIIFDEEDQVVKLIEVNESGYANYDNPIVLHIKTVIDIKDDYSKYVGIMGNYIRDFIMNILKAYKIDKGIS